MKFGLIFGHAASNFGDLAINTGAISLLRELDPECHVHVVFDAPQATYQEAAISSISHVQDVTYVFHPKRIPEKHSRGPLQRLQRYIADPELFLADNGLEDCDVLFYNSGEHLFSSREDENALSLAWRTVAALAAKAGGKKFITLPVTFGPLTGVRGTQLLHQFCALSDGLAAREPASTEVLMQQEPVRTHPSWLLDPAFFLRPVSEPSTAPGRPPVLGLVLRLEDYGLRMGAQRSARALAVHKSHGYRDSRAHQLGMLLGRRHVAETGGSVKILVQTLADRDFSIALAEDLTSELGAGAVEVIQAGSLSEYRQHLVGLDGLVSARFHACIFAMLQGVPVFGVHSEVHGHKMPGLYRALGMPDACRELLDSTLEDVADAALTFLRDAGEKRTLAQLLKKKRQETVAWLRAGVDAKAHHPDLLSATRILTSVAWDLAAEQYRKDIKLVESEGAKQLQSVQEDCRAAVEENRKLAASMSKAGESHVAELELQKQERVAMQEHSRDAVALLREESRRLEAEVARLSDDTERRMQKEREMDEVVSRQLKQREDDGVRHETVVQGLHTAIAEQAARHAAEIDQREQALGSLRREVEDWMRRHEAEMERRTLALRELEDTLAQQGMRHEAESARQQASLQDLAMAVKASEERNAEEVRRSASVQRELEKAVDGLSKRDALVAELQQTVGSQVRRLEEQEQDSQQRESIHKKTKKRQQLMLRQVEGDLVRISREHHAAVTRAEHATAIVARQALLIDARDIELEHAKNYALLLENSRRHKLGTALVDALKGWRGAVRLPSALLSVLRSGAPVVTSPVPVFPAASAPALGTPLSSVAKPVAGPSDTTVMPRQADPVEIGPEGGVLVPDVTSNGITIEETLAVGHPMSTPPVPSIPSTKRALTQDEKSALDTALAERAMVGGVDEVLKYSLAVSSQAVSHLRSYVLVRAANAVRSLGDLEGVYQLAVLAQQADDNKLSLYCIASAAFELCRYAEAMSHAERLKATHGPLSGANLKLVDEIEGYGRLDAELRGEPASRESVETVDGRSVYILHSSLPHLSGGYALRGHGLIGGVKKAGFDIRPYTRPGFPEDIGSSSYAVKVEEADEIDGVVYHRIAAQTARSAGEQRYMNGCVDAFMDVLRTERPAVVHGRSTYLISVPALIAARRLGLPFVYEVSGLWELVHESRESAAKTRARTDRMRHFETLACLAADQVLTLTEAMRDELVARGVPAEKITLVPNSVDPGKYLPRPKNNELEATLGLPPDVPVVGYVGSFVDYEGLDDLVLALEQVAAAGQEFRLLLVGDGPEHARIRQLVEESPISGHTLITGRVPHDQVEGYYSLIDICPFPRKPWEVCEVVSPMKPFEPMAMEKAVVVSDTRALCDIIEHDVTGLRFSKGSVSALADVLGKLIAEPALRRRLGLQAREWVIEHRSWDAVGKRVVEQYGKAMSARD
ncbi:glycosyltransferase [Pseudoxanthomonas sp. PXM02]|uniref:glycosyltransferase n=1 Tax=Pseudoxanthomonas sp. PXM02 TaxID=2769294 RepID=UPI0017811E02|nr:glycosyltransferase [Pseudoxanthomonas sp. PXM02]MBD9479346.1 glycosyltransferase [Pseudoxanthomonas sp. PXM02]